VRAIWSRSAAAKPIGPTPQSTASMWQQATLDAISHSTCSHQNCFPMPKFSNLPPLTSLKAASRQRSICARRAHSTMVIEWLLRLVAPIFKKEMAISSLDCRVLFLAHSTMSVSAYCFLDHIPKLPRVPTSLRVGVGTITTWGFRRTCERFLPVRHQPLS
jgi:hypothetical protein